MNLFGWFLLLILQNAAFTWVSRARNSGSVSYHAIASVFSNGIFFVSNLFLIGIAAQPGLPFPEMIKLGVIYIAGTVTGSVLMHVVSMRYLEKGKRKVGA